MKENIKELNRIWRTMLWVTVVTVALVVGKLLYTGDWATALLASTVFGMLRVLHRNRTITFSALKTQRNATVESELKGLEESIASLKAQYKVSVENDLRSLDESLKLKWKIREYEFLLDGLQRLAPTCEDAELRKHVNDILKLYYVRRTIELEKLESK